LTDTESGILRSVLSYPDNDLPRLEYADYITGRHGGFQADFIRKQLAGELATVPMTARGDLEEVFRVQPHRWESMADRRCAKLRYGGITLTYTRGFVSAVDGPYTSLLGTACSGVGEHHGDACAGGRVMAANSQFYCDCPTCGGSGLVGGFLHKLFQRQPVTSVVPIGLNSEPVHFSGGYRPQAWTPRAIHPEILEEVRVSDTHMFETPGGPGSVLSYTSEFEANDAMSRGLVRYFRRRSGLPTLP